MTAEALQLKALKAFTQNAIDCFTKLTQPLRAAVQRAEVALYCGKPDAAPALKQASAAAAEVERVMRQVIDE